MRRYLLFFFCIILLNCSSNDVEKEETKTLIVASETRNCIGIAIQDCLLIKEKENDSWTFFYDEIKGFNYEEGFEYVLSVLEIEKNLVPAGASFIETTLVKIISKKKKPSSNLP